MSGDLYFNNVKLLLHMDGSDDGTTFTDVTGRTMTRVNAVTKTGVKKFGTASAYFDGSGDYLTVPYHVDLAQWWTADFTLECWVYPVSLTTASTTIGSYNVPVLFGNHSPINNTCYWAFGPRTDGKLGFYSTARDVVVSAATINTGEWTHIAVVRDASNVTLYVNGVGNTPTANWTGSSSGGATMTMGQSNNVCFNGYVDDLRLTKGVARYTGNFDVPTEAFPDVLLVPKVARMPQFQNRAAFINNRIRYQGL